MIRRFASQRRCRRAVGLFRHTRFSSVIADKMLEKALDVVRAALRRRTTYLVLLVVVVVFIMVPVVRIEAPSKPVGELHALVYALQRAQASGRPTISIPETFGEREWARAAGEADVTVWRASAMRTFRRSPVVVCDPAITGWGVALIPVTLSYSGVQQVVLPVSPLQCLQCPESGSLLFCVFVLGSSHARLRHSRRAKELLATFALHPPPLIFELDQRGKLARIRRSWPGIKTERRCFQRMDGRYKICYNDSRGEALFPTSSPAQPGSPSAVRTTSCNCTQTENFPRFWTRRFSQQNMIHEALFTFVSESTGFVLFR